LAVLELGGRAEYNSLVRKLEEFSQRGWENAERDLREAIVNRWIVGAGARGVFRLPK
jgi:hypothetical protein